MEQMNKTAYKLLIDSPEAKAGSIFQYNKEQDCYFMVSGELQVDLNYEGVDGVICYNKRVVETQPQWFEEGEWVWQPIKHDTKEE